MPTLITLIGSPTDRQKRAAKHEAGIALNRIDWYAAYLAYERGVTDATKNHWAYAQQIANRVAPAGVKYALVLA